MKRLLLLSALVAFIPSIGFAACPCVPKSVGEKYGNANAVFRGIMTKVEELPGPTRTERVTFSLEESWKGTGDPEQTVIFPVSVDACGLPQEEVGKSYLVYARATTAQGGSLESSMCDGTDLAEILPADIRFLNHLYRPGRDMSSSAVSTGAGNISATARTKSRGITLSAHGRGSRARQRLASRACVPNEDSAIHSVDMRRVRTAWLGFYNDVRVSRGLQPYRLEPQLNRTASIWSSRSANRGVIEHKRDGTAAYYDYSAIESWFSRHGLTFQNQHSITFTENIGRGPYECASRDCTDDLIAAIRSTFDFYLSEESHEYRPHFKAIVNPYFRIMGVGVSVRGGQYYLTAHFGTKITSSPGVVCGGR